MIETAVYNRLNTNLGSAVTGVYPATATENTQLPFVVYTVAESEPIRTLNGPAGYRHQLTVEAVGINYDTVQNIAALVQTALEGWQQTPNIVYATQTAAGAESLEYGHQYSLVFVVYESATPMDFITEEDGSFILLEQ